MTLIKIFTPVCVLAIFVLSFYVYILNEALKEKQLYIEKQATEIAILEMNQFTLKTIIESQNKKIEDYKSESEVFEQKINELNKELEKEHVQTVFEHPETNISEKEAIEWLKSKRGSVSF